MWPPLLLEDYWEDYLGWKFLDLALILLSQQCWVSSADSHPPTWRIIGRIIWGCRRGCTGASQSPASYKGTPQCIPFCHSWTLDSTTSKVGQGINSLLSMATPCVNPMRHPCFLVESVHIWGSLKEVLSNKYPHQTVQKSAQIKVFWKPRFLKLYFSKT